MKLRKSLFRPLNQNGPDHLTLLVIPNFSMNAFVGLVETLRLANYASGRTLYQWEIISRDGQPVTASNGVSIQCHHSIAELSRTPSTLAVCSGIDGHLFKDAVVMGYLRRWAREGCHLGAVCTGTAILAHAGLMKGYRCTIHWENLDTLSEEFPDLELRSELFEIDRDRFSCAGGLAATDMMLSEITAKHGADLAASVSQQLILERMRSGQDSQKIPLKGRLRITHPRLLKAIETMESHAEDVLDRDDIAEQVGLSRRQLERLFRRYLNTSPARFYLKLRLDRARLLLTQSSIPITEIAFACGFTSASHFSKCYRDMFGYTPRAQRNRNSPYELEDSDHSEDDTLDDDEA